MSRRIPSITAILVAVFVTGCSEQLQDRGGQEGAPPDFVGDVDYVEVYRNADAFPNAARICIRGIGFAGTSTSRGESGGSGPVIRVAEWDGFCARHATQR